MENKSQQGASCSEPHSDVPLPEGTVEKGLMSDECAVTKNKLQQGASCSQPKYDIPHPEATVEKGMSDESTITKNEYAVCAYCKRTYPKNYPHTCKQWLPKRYKCDVCSEFFEKGELEQHRRTHTRERQSFMCRFCNRKFSEERFMKRHFDTHIGKWPYECPVCDKKFMTKGNLSNHHKTHTGEQRYVCGVCGKPFAHQQGLTQHKCAKSREEGQKQACDICNETFSQENLKSHRSIHRKGKLYACESCKKVFKRVDGLKKHRRIHAGERPCRDTVIVYAKSMPSTSKQ